MNRRRLPPGLGRYFPPGGAAYLDRRERCTDPRPAPEAPEGVTVYDRHFPHPGDNAGNLWGRPRPDMSKMRAVTTDGITLLFVPEE